MADELKINERNFIMIQGWMRTKLHLKGNELLVYAIIYGFCQDGEHTFNGSLQYLADWCGATRQGIINNLKSLLNKGYIFKEESKNSGICNYGISNLSLQETDKIDNPGVNKVDTPCKQSLLNNIDNKKNNKIISKDIIQKNSKKSSLWDRCINLIDNFTSDDILREWLVEFLKRCIDNSKESGIPFYTNTFKGKLNKLKQLSTDNYIQRKIILQTLDNGWNAFYELKEENQYKSKKKDIFSQQGITKSESYTKDEIEELEQIDKERERKGLKVEF